MVLLPGGVGIRAHFKGHPKQPDKSALIRTLSRSHLPLSETFSSFCSENKKSRFPHSAVPRDYKHFSRFDSRPTAPVSWNEIGNIEIERGETLDSGCRTCTGQFTDTTRVGYLVTMFRDGLNIFHPYQLSIKHISPSAVVWLGPRTLS